MTKSDYDKYYKKGGTYVIPIEIFNELFDELERLSFNYEQALEDLDKKENIIKEVREYIDENVFHSKNQEEQELYDIALLEILDKVGDEK